MLIKHLWQLKTVVFLHWCLICAALLNWVCFFSGQRNDKLTKVPITEKSSELFWTPITDESQQILLPFFNDMYWHLERDETLLGL